MITLDSLIANVPEAKDIDGLSDWFAEAVLWADENNEFQLSLDANMGLKMFHNKNTMEEYRRIVLSRLKAIKKSQE